MNKKPGCSEPFKIKNGFGDIKKLQKWKITTIFCSEEQITQTVPIKKNKGKNRGTKI